MRLLPTCLLIAATVCTSAVALQSASAATEERLSKPELLKLNECMSMKPDVLTEDGQCGAVLKKANITKTDVETMRRCESILSDEVLKDPGCAAVIKKHPDLVRGHGRLDPQEPDKTTK
jgi:hypothetical protein